MSRKCEDFHHIQSFFLQCLVSPQINSGKLGGDERFSCNALGVLSDTQVDCTSPCLSLLESSERQIFQQSV